MTTAAPRNHHHIGSRLKRVIRAFLCSHVRWKAILLFVALILLMVALNALNVLSSYIGRDFVSAIEQREAPRFVSLGWSYLGAFVLLTFTSAWFRFAEERLGLLWREWQTRQLLSDYLERRTYYHVGRLGLVENPDQNIAEDVRSFTTSTLSFALMFLNGTFTAISFSGVLWSISPKLFAISVTYAFAGTLFTVLLGKPLIRLNYQQLDKEANFRSELLHVRENADEIAITRREGRARSNLTARLDALLQNMRHMISVNRNLAFFTMGYGYMIQLIPYVIVAPMFISETAEFGVITQSVVAFAQLMGAFSLIVTQFQSISAYTAVVSRLGRLMDGMEQASAQDASLVTLQSGGDPGFEDLTLQQEEGTPILKSLTYRLPPGQWLLIDGHSEPAKRLLFRVMAGLSGNGTGKVLLPEGQVDFVPERPYLHAGPLRENLVHARLDAEISDAQVLATLRELDLDSVAERGLHTPQNWDKELPLATQQLLVIARVLLSGSTVVVIDHLLSSLTNDGLTKVFAILRARRLTCFYFGSAEEPPELFDSVLRVSPDGSWTINSPASTT